MMLNAVTKNIAESHQICVELLITDAETAMTLLDLAETTEVAEFRSRRVAEAHQAYQSILSFLPRLEPSADQLRVLSEALRTLETRLEAAGLGGEQRP